MHGYLFIYLWIDWLIYLFVDLFANLFIDLILKKKVAKRNE